VLETIRPFYIFLGIFEDNGPIVPLVKYLVPSSLVCKVASTWTFMAGFQDLMDLVFFHGSSDNKIQSCVEEATVDP
jgi:hypothetical protein